MVMVGLMITVMGIYEAYAMRAMLDVRGSRGQQQCTRLSQKDYALSRPAIQGYGHDRNFL
jgi:hypothetical protein